MHNLPGSTILAELIYDEAAVIMFLLWLGLKRAGIKKGRKILIFWMIAFLAIGIALLVVPA